jgi:hypothetical protein
VLQSAVCVLGAVQRVTRRTAPSTHTALQTEAHIATAQLQFLLIISTKTVTLARFRRKLPDDGPNGPKHVGAI